MLMHTLNQMHFYQPLPPLLLIGGLPACLVGHALADCMMLGHHHGPNIISWYNANLAVNAMPDPSISFELQC